MQLQCSGLWPRMRPCVGSDLPSISGLAGAAGRPFGASRESLQSVTAGEPRDVRYGYPAMAHAARDDGFDAIAAWFEALAKTEWLHAKRFKDLLASIVEMKC